MKNPNRFRTPFNGHLPHDFAIRPYQQPYWRNLVGRVEEQRKKDFEDYGPRIILNWHRRTGKDLGLIHGAVCCSQLREGNYLHVFPTFRRARLSIWRGKDRSGRPFLDAFPQELFTRDPLEDEMTIFLRCGKAGESSWTLVGCDNFDVAVGSNVVGVVFSEYSQCDPTVWELVRPILAENGGWAAFPSTPRGLNHYKELYDQHKEDPDWFVQTLTVDDTNVIKPEILEKERRSMSQDLFRQEYYCEFTASADGVVYGKEMRKMQEDGRIRRLPILSNVPVEVWWDIGVRDATAMVFVQYVDDMIHVIDYYENRGHQLPHYAKQLYGQDPEDPQCRRRQGYIYYRHVMPADIETRQIVGNRMRACQELGIWPVYPNDACPPNALADEIEMTRVFLSRLVIDPIRCKRLVECLSNYHYEWDDAKQVFRTKPEHDWASHACDAIRAGAKGGRKPGVIFPHGTIENTGYLVNVNN